MILFKKATRKGGKERKVIMKKEDRRKRALDISAKKEANYIKTFFEGGENQLEISYDFCHDIGMIPLDQRRKMEQNPSYYRYYVYAPKTKGYAPVVELDEFLATTRIIDGSYHAALREPFIPFVKNKKLQLKKEFFPPFLVRFQKEINEYGIEVDVARESCFASSKKGKQFMERYNSGDKNIEVFDINADIDLYIAWVLFDKFITDYVPNVWA